MQPNAPLTLVRSHQYLQNLAKGPPKYNLLKSDQDVLLRAEAKYNSRAVLTMAIGLGLGIFAAFRDRRAKMKVFKALRGDQIPIYFRFANGTQGMLVASRSTAAYPLIHYAQNRSRARHCRSCETFQTW